MYDVYMGDRNWSGEVTVDCFVNEFIIYPMILSRDMTHTHI